MDAKDSKPFLIIEPPSQVRFSGPFTRPVVTTLTLVNPTDFKIIFKIKTTAPLFYGVRPNFGVVQPRNFAEVEIARQPFIFDPNEKINHKFMVQSLVAPSGIEDLNNFWENADPSQLMSSKLKCVFEMPSMESTIPRTIKLPDVSTSHDKSRHERNERYDRLEIAEKFDKPERTERVERFDKIENIDKPITAHLKIDRNDRNDRGSRVSDIKEKPYIVDRLEKRQESEDMVLKRQLEILNSELRQLRMENNALRKENIILKDEIEQIRSMPIKRDFNSMKPEMLMETKSVPMLYILSSVTMAIVCILIGKFIL